jgi:hypothetical protein
MNPKRPKAAAVKVDRPSRDDPAQSRAFIKKAREIEADEAASRADDLMGRLAKRPPDPKPKRRSTH